MIFWCISEHLTSSASVNLRVCESSLIVSGITHLDEMLWMQEMLRSFCKWEKVTWKGRARASRHNRRDAGGERSASEKPAFISCKSVLPFQPIFLICPHLMSHLLNFNLRQAKDKKHKTLCPWLSHATSSFPKKAKYAEESDTETPVLAGQIKMLDSLVLQHKINVAH